MEETVQMSPSMKTGINISFAKPGAYLNITVVKSKSTDLFIRHYFNRVEKEKIPVNTTTGPLALRFYLDKSGEYRFSLSRDLHNASYLTVTVFPQIKIGDTEILSIDRLSILQVPANIINKNTPAWMASHGFNALRSLQLSEPVKSGNSIDSLLISGKSSFSNWKDFSKIMRDSFNTKGVGAINDAILTYSTTDSHLVRSDINFLVSLENHPQLKAAYIIDNIVKSTLYSNDELSIGTMILKLSSLFEEKREELMQVMTLSFESINIDPLKRTEDLTSLRKDRKQVMLMNSLTPRVVDQQLLNNLFNSKEDGDIDCLQDVIAWANQELPTYLQFIKHEIIFNSKQYFSKQHTLPLYFRNVRIGGYIYHVLNGVGFQNGVINYDMLLTRSYVCSDCNAVINFDHEGTRAVLLRYVKALAQASTIGLYIPYIQNLPADFQDKLIHDIYDEFPSIFILSPMNYDFQL